MLDDGVAVSCKGQASLVILYRDLKGTEGPSSAGLLLLFACLTKT